jgi:hypothetical protein
MILQLDAALVFSVVNNAVLGPWFLLLFFPKNTLTRRWVRSGFFSLVLSVVYLICFVTAQLQQHEPKGGFGSLAEVMILFKNEWGVLTGWVHYLAFDLLVGAAVLLRLEKAGKGSLAYRAPVLFFTLMLGPVGYLLSEIICRFFGSKIQDPDVDF